MICLCQSQADLTNKVKVNYEDNRESTMAKMSVTMQDAYGRTTHRTYGLVAQVDLATYASVAAAFLAALEDVTDLGVTRADLILPVLSPEFDAIAGANVDVGATASGLIEGGGGKKAAMKIPGIKAALVNADGSVPITGDVATFLAEFEDAADWNLSDGEQIASWIRATLDR